MKRRLGGRDTQPTAKSIEILDGLIGNRERDHGIDHVRIRLHPRQRRPKQRARVTDRERRNKHDDLRETVQEQNHPKQEKQVIVARKHVFRADPRRVQEVADQHLMLRSFANGMRDGDARKQCCNRKMYS